MTNTLINAYVGSGLAANRPAAPAIAAGAMAWWYSTDTQELSFWTGSAWSFVTASGGAHPGWKAGNFYPGAPIASTTAFTLSANTMHFSPFYVPKRYTINAALLNVTGAVAASTVRMGIYDSQDSTPVNLISDFGTVSGAATGNQSITGLSVTLNPGWYNTVMLSASAVGVRSANVALTPFIDGWNSSPSTNVPGVFVTAAQAAGPLPATSPAIAQNTLGGWPLVLLSR